MAAQIAQILRTQCELMLQSNKRLPGVTVSVAMPDGMLASAAAGYADRQLQRPMTISAKMPAGSIGKTFVAAVVLSMVADGILVLDAPIAPWFANTNWFCRLPNYKTITLRHLLNHSSGLIDHVFDTGISFTNFIKQKLVDEMLHQPIAAEELIQFALDRPPLFLAGMGFHYSDTGYVLIGMLIERASSASYYATLSQRLLKPRHLADTLAFDCIDIPRLVQGYAQQSRRLFGIPKRMLEHGQLVLHPSLEWTGGGIVSTTADLVRWAKALFEGSVLTPVLLTQMLTSIARPKPLADDTGCMLGYGLGVNIVKSAFGTCYRHDGFFPGYNSVLAYFPDKKIAIAMQVNTDNVSMEAYFKALITAVFYHLEQHENCDSIIDNI
ncbi:serine hydrolase domain-containing protein [Rheinheimera metallidurans]|uniref:serine hydrolase domain-containing protein n=1 Tax=Rheinheimera metallidurans TaxID=2925781 RepID=UPI003002DAAF